MAFKMKGSPIKLGGIQGTSGHASALKQGVVSPMKHTKDQEHYHGPKYLPDSYGGKNVRQEWKDAFSPGGKIYEEIKEKNPDKSHEELRRLKSFQKRQYQWIEDWRHKTNDPTMPSKEQAKKIIPGWSQYGEENVGKSLNELWNVAVPTSGSSHHGRIINANTGEGAAVPSWQHDQIDDRSEEDKAYDEAKYENIFSQNPQTLEEQGIIDPRKIREMEKKELEEEKAAEKLKQDELNEVLKKQKEEEEAKRIEKERIANLPVGHPDRPVTKRPVPDKPPVFGYHDEEGNPI